ncbi:MAG: alpha/beta fold hydrolase [Candidatus Binataceae bacterium]
MMKSFAWVMSLVAFTLLLPAAADASGSAELRCDQLLTSLREENFGEATRHFDATVKAALSAAQLESVWKSLTAPHGKLIGWKLAQTIDAPNKEVLIHNLTFADRGTMPATVGVSRSDNEITDLFFKPIQPASSAASPAYSNSGSFRSEDVIVGAGATKLPGTLTVPNGSGPFPAAILVHGSGPQNRDETIGANRPFRDIAEGLSSRGVMVLRYDKRTYAGLIVDPQNVNVDVEVIDDAVAAVKFLRTRRDVASDRIFVIGHSLGAYLAPEIALKSKPTAGIVLLAPMGRKLPEVIVEQTRFLGQGSPDAVAEIERKANLLSSHKMPQTERFLGAPASYYYDLDARDEVAIARSLDEPILILHGGRDYQVIDKDIERWERGLSGRATVKVKKFPSLNHLFIKGEGKPSPSEYETPGNVDVAVISAMVDFIAGASGGQGSSGSR